MSREIAKKIPPGALKLQIFGDMLRAVKTEASDDLPVKKFDVLSESLVSKSREDRVILYKFLCGLALTAHARRTIQEAPRKAIFAAKNDIFLSIVNNFENRRKLNFRLCVSPRFKVVKYCSSCEEKNQRENLDPREMKFCKDCEIDRSYYNVLSVFHRYAEGGTSLFLGQDLLGQVFPIKELKKVPMGKFKEELVFRNFHFSPRNLHALALDSVLEVSEKLLKIAPPTLVVDPEKMKRSGHGIQKSGPQSSRSKSGPSTAARPQKASRGGIGESAEPKRAT